MILKKAGRFMFEELEHHIPEIIDWERYKQTAVLIPILETQKGPEVLFEVRSHNLESQPGEICFPGGQLEEHELEVDAIIRETTEELLIPSGDIDIICPMHKYTSPYQLLVHSYLGILNNYHGTYSKDEVAEVFSVPLDYFMTTEPVSYFHKIYMQPEKGFPYHLIPGGIKYPWRRGEYEVNFYQYGERVIWGITAKLMKAAVELLKKKDRSRADES